MFNASHSSHNWKKRKLFFIIIIPLLFLALSGIVMLLWNAILPDVIHAGVINYWQALGLLALCRILFGGFGFRGDNGSGHFAKAQEMREKWTSMTDEEKRKFKEEYKARCTHRDH